MPRRSAASARPTGFEVAVVPQVEVEGIRVSSSAIRQSLVAGDLATAARHAGTARTT